MNWRRGAALLCAGAIASLLWVSTAAGQEWWDASRNGIPEPSIETSLPQNGDPSGVRKWLGGRGVVFGLEYTNDLLSNLRGGLRTGTVYQGKLQGIVTVDLGKLGWDGLSLFANAFQIHVGSSRVDLQACKLEYSIVSPK